MRTTSMDNAPARVLVVDDEATLVETIRYNLRREGYQVLVAFDGEAALAVARRERPDLMVLDLMLPKLSGLDVCRILRQETAMPILMLTAKDDEVDKVLGLELGADDYMTKPFSMRELLARVKAMLRRAQMQGQESARTGERMPQPLTYRGLTVDPNRRSVTCQQEEVPLRPKEFDLLAFFLSHRGQALSRDLILERVWGYDYAGDTRTVDVHVRWLRAKIQKEPDQPPYIHTVRGVGYRFE